MKKIFFFTQGNTNDVIILHSNVHLKHVMSLDNNKIIILFCFIFYFIHVLLMTCHRDSVIGSRQAQLKG